MNISKIFKIDGISEFENLAYRLYWNDNRSVQESSINFIKHKNKYVYYYEKANILLRKEKIKKICLSQEIE